MRVRDSAVRDHSQSKEGVKKIKKKLLDGVKGMVNTPHALSEKILSFDHNCLQCAERNTGR